MVKTSSGIATRFLVEEEFDAWREFVDASPSGSIYSYPEYLDALCKNGGGSFRVLGAFRGQELHGGIALYDRAGMGGRVLDGRLLLYYNGIVLRSFEGKYPSKTTSKELAVMEALEGALAAEGYHHVALRNRHPIQDVRPFLSAGWYAKPSYSLVLKFGDSEEAFHRIEQNQRRLISRCEEAGVALEADGDFDAFFRLHVGTHERKGSPIYLPEPSFRAYFQSLSDLGLCRLFHARASDGRSLASQLVLLGSHPTTHTVAAAADPEFLRMGTTPFLRWKVCEALASEGYSGNDLTDASLNDVTRFKSQMGADLVTNLILSRPDRLRYRLHRIMRRVYWGPRARLGAAYRSFRSPEDTASQA